MYTKKNTQLRPPVRIKENTKNIKETPYICRLTSEYHYQLSSPKERITAWYQYKNITFPLTLH
jgi:hypothetical protein